MPTYLVRHVTTYTYGNNVAFGEHRMMLCPRESADQHTREASLEITPTPTEVRWSDDASGNRVGIARFGRRARELRIVSTARVTQRPFREAELAIADHARACPFSYGAEEMPDLVRFVERQHPDAQHALDSWVRQLLDEDPGRSTWSFLKRLNGAIRRDFGYRRREEAGIQSPALTLKLRGGSCRDFAVLMCEAVRSLGFAARFVSGYLWTGNGDAQVLRAGGSTHAWLQVYLPGAGWIDFDPTSGATGNRGLIRVAVVRDPGQAAPLSGSFMGFPQDFVGMSVSVDVALADDEGAMAACEAA